MSIGEQYLHLPGPTPVPERILRAMNRPMINHRGPEFQDILFEVTTGVKKIYQTNQNLLIYPSSGTGVLEAAIVNFISPGEKVLSISIGVFGDRFATIAQNFGAEVEQIKFKWGESADPDLIRDKLQQDKNKQIKAVVITHNETSTGVYNDIALIKEAMEEHPALLLVDAVSGLGALEFRMDDWGVDVALSGSQKAFMIPPGLGFMAFSDRALEKHKKTNNHRFYWDVSAGLKYLEKGQTAFTPAISIFYGLQESLRMMFEEGLENILKRHKNYRYLVREAIKELGLELLAADKNASTALTAVIAPGRKGANKLRSYMLNRFNIVLAGGQLNLDDVMFRIGHLGYIRVLDLLAVIGALEITLQKFGYPVELGAGINKIQRIIAAEDN
jgi:aspartate aminotransferase-like enzyme